MPLYTQQVTIQRVNSNIVISACHIKLSHEGPSAPVHNAIYKGVDSHILDGECKLGDAIVDTVAFWGREVQD